MQSTKTLAHSTSICVLYCIHRRCNSNSGLHGTTGSELEHCCYCDVCASLWPQVVQQCNKRNNVLFSTVFSAVEFTTDDTIGSTIRLRGVYRTRDRLCMSHTVVMESIGIECNIRGINQHLRERGNVLQYRSFASACSSAFSRAF